MSTPAEIRDILKRLNRVEAQLSKLPSRIGAGGGGGGSLADEIFFYVEDEDDLPNPAGFERGVFGIVTEGADEGMLYIINPAGDGWDCLTKFQ